MVCLVMVFENGFLVLKNKKNKDNENEENTKNMSFFMF